MSPKNNTLSPGSVGRMLEPAVGERRMDEVTPSGFQLNCRARWRREYGSCAAESASHETGRRIDDCATNTCLGLDAILSCAPQCPFP